jgi:hypothetical protein
MFPTWSSGVIHGQIIDTDADGNAYLWGPVFELSPGFTGLAGPHATPVLGRADFFLAFGVRFDEVAAVMEIEERT